MSELAISVISSVTVSSALVGIVLFLSKSWITERLKNSIKHEYDQKLEVHKAQLKSEQEVAMLELRSLVEKESIVQQAGHSSLHQVQKAAIEKKLVSIEKLWDGIVKARNEIPPIIGMLDILTIDEYPTIASNKELAKLAEPFTPEKLGEISMKFGENVESVRPYVGEYLWSIFYAYRAVTIRTLLLMKLGLIDPRKLNWHEDEGIKSLISSVLSKKQIEYFDSQDFGKFKLLQDHFETLMLTAMNKIISGEEFGSEMMSQAKTIARKANELANQKP